jgi:hypothetical protein
VQHRGAEQHRRERAAEHEEEVVEHGVNATKLSRRSVQISLIDDDDRSDIFSGSHEFTPAPMLAGVSDELAQTARRSFT